MPPTSTQLTRKKKPAPKGGIWSIVETEVHHKVGISLLLGAITGVVSLQYLSVSVSLILSWDAFALCFLILAWLGMFQLNARCRVREARLQDSGHTAIVLCVVLASIAGFAGAGILFSAAKALSGFEATKDVVLAVVTVCSSWTLVHTMMSMHYAHVYYSTRTNDDADADEEEHDDHEEEGSDYGDGLTFPDEKNPDFLDFAYFSFVIGMTFQVSDVVITSRRIRRIVLLHGALSFAFNTVILAFSVNLGATLL